MAKTYWVTFGTGNPVSNAGLSPTFLQFWKSDGTTLAPPSISEIGSSSGLYKFSYTPSFSVGFVIDGFTTGLLSNSRYISGNLDIADAVDTLLDNNIGASVIAIGVSLRAVGTSIIAMGNTLLAIGSSDAGIGVTLLSIAGLIGSTTSSFGSTSVDPADMLGYLRRAQEVWEGNAQFGKSTGSWQMWSRGSSTLLRVKTMSNDSVGVTKI